MVQRAASSSRSFQRILAGLTVLGLIAVPGLAAAAPATGAPSVAGAAGATDATSAATAAGVAGAAEGERLLVTYTTAVDGGDEAAAFRTASVVADADIDRSAVQVLSFDDPAERAAAARQLAARPDVIAVEADQPVYPDMQVHEVIEVSAASASPSSTASFATASTTAPPSWGVANQGQMIEGTPGVVGVDVGAEIAHRHASGRGVVVAVIDSGVDIAHPLLQGRIWTNPDEVADGLDSDENGYIDDVNGWNFARGTAQVFDDATRDAHGTHVAGIIVGAAQPAYGFRSVAPDATVMPLKFIDGESGMLSDAIAAIRYAIDNGADVINASWGGDQPSAALQQVLAESPIPVVISAGNLGAPLEESVSYPAAYGLDTTIVVAAITHDAQLASFSSTSRELVDVAAPGARILGPWPGNRLAVASGTSQAAPHVSGVVALAMQRHPNLDATEMAAAVRATVRPLEAATPTIAGGIVRAPALLDHLGTRVPACDADASTLPFGDVSATSPHREAIACLVSLGITNGIDVDAFGSSRGLTRAQIAALVGRAFAQVDALPAAPSAGRFTDVAADSTHWGAIETLAAIGVVEGVSATTYEPQRITTRAELAAIVARAAEYLSQGEVRVRGAGFVDTAGVSEQVEIAKSAGLRIVLGKADGRFEPGAPVRRDQAASMIGRLLDRWAQQGLLSLGSDAGGLAS